MGLRQGPASDTTHSYSLLKLKYPDVIGKNQWKLSRPTKLCHALHYVKFDIVRDSQTSGKMIKVKEVKESKKRDPCKMHACLEFKVDVACWRSISHETGQINIPFSPKAEKRRKGLSTVRNEV